MLNVPKDPFEIPEHLWHDIPDPISKLLRVFASTLLSHDSILQNLQKQPPHPSSPENDQTEKLSTKIKHMDSQVSTRLAVHTTKINTKMDSIEVKLSNLKETLESQTQSIWSTLNSLQLDKKLESFKHELKQEILNESIKPFEFELKDTFKTISFIEQQIKLQNWNIDATLKEFNCRFEVHREKICKIENIFEEFIKQVDEIIMKQITPVRKSIELVEIGIKNFYKKFQDEVEEILKELADKDDDRLALFNESMEKINKLKLEIEKSIKGLYSMNATYVQKLEVTMSQFQLQMENFKCEIQISQRECYQDAKNELVKTYRKDILVLEDKLRWLPSNMQDISEMTPMEARLYTIETRIKNEETNRIQQVNDILNGKNHSELGKLFMKSRKRGHKEQKKLSFSTNRSNTPVPVPTRVCKSPGGMRLMASKSNCRIYRIVENDSIVNPSNSKQL